MRLIEELRRRNVLRVGSAWVVGAWLVAQVAEFLTETFAAPLWVLQSIVVALSVATVPVLVLTWMFEFTPQGLRRQAELDRAGVVSARSGRRLDYLIAVMLLLAAGWLALAWSQRMREAQQQAAPADASPPVAGAAPAVVEAPANSVAVLPFLDLSRVDESAVLADGLAEELLGTLGRNRALRVTARSSAFQFKGQNRDLREVGRLLGVRYVLEGSVRLAGERTRIGAQLVDAASGVQLWSESYDRTLADLFALQDEIAANVARALHAVLVEGDPALAVRGTASAEAHMALLRALRLGASRVVADLDQAIVQLQQAIAIDPGYAAAYLELAYAIHTRALQLGEDEVRTAMPVIAPLIDKALALDPASGPALVLRGALLMGEDATAGERAIRAGLALAPSHARGYEILAGRVGEDPARFDEAIALLDQAIALDPLSPRNYQMKGILYWHGRDDLETAKRFFARALEVEPRFRNGLLQLTTASMMLGEFAEAIDYAERLRDLGHAGPEFAELMFLHHLNIGDTEAARAEAGNAGALAEIALLAIDERYDEALGRLRALPAPPPGFLSGGLAPVLTLRNARAHGSWDEDIAIAMQGYDGRLADDHSPRALAYVFWVALLRGAGRETEALELERSVLARLERIDALGLSWLQPMTALQRAMVHASGGRTGEALDALEQAFRTPRPMWWLLLDRNPLFEPLHAEPRYQALRARLERQLASERERLQALRRARAPA